MHRQLMSDYYIPDDTYSPSFEVKYGSDLSPDSFDLDFSYFEQAGGISIILAIAGLLAIALFLVGLLFRCCCQCCRCLPTYLAPEEEYHEEEDDDDDDLEESPKKKAVSKQYPWNAKKTWSVVALVVLACIALGCDQMILVGRWKVSKGVQTTSSVVDSFNDIVLVVQNDSDILVSFTPILQNELDSAEATCPALTTVSGDLQSAINDYANSVESLQAAVDPLSGKLDDYQFYFSYYAEGAILFILWSICVLGILLLIAFTFAQRRDGLKAVVGYLTFVYVIFVLVGVVWFAMTAILGDLCMEPSSNIVNSLPAQSDVQNITYYYATCSGTSIIQQDIAEAQYYVDYFNTMIDVATTSICPNNSALLDMKQTVGQINATIANIDETTDCPPLQSLWRELVNSGLCGHFYSGLFYVWGATILTAFFLFFLILTSSVVYQFFLDVDKLPQATIHASEPIHLEVREVSPRRESNHSSVREDDLSSRGSDEGLAEAFNQRLNTPR